MYLIHRLSKILRKDQEIIKKSVKPDIKSKHVIEVNMRTCYEHGNQMRNQVINNVLVYGHYDIKSKVDKGFN